MDRAYVAVVVLLSSAIVTGRCRGVTFVQKKTLDPCEDKILRFATLADGASKKISHAFRMRCTDILFTVSNTNNVANWRESTTNGMDLSLEFSFFRRQAETISSGFGALLQRSVTVEPMYEFDSATGDYIFQLFIDTNLACMYAGGKVNYYPGYYNLDAATKEQIEKHSKGIGVDVLKGDTKTLALKWRNFCSLLRAVENNATDEYSLRYDGERGGLECSVRSKTPWRHLVLFGQSPASKISRSRDAETGVYTTAGFRVHDRRGTSVCNITSPNGMIALQTFEAQIPTTPLPTVETTVLFSTLSVEKDESPDDSFDPRIGTVAIAVPLVLVVVFILGGGLGLFVFRDRVGRFVAGFRRASAEGR